MTTEFNIFVNHPDHYRCHFKLTEDDSKVLLKRVGDLLAWLNENGYTPSFKTNDVLDFDLPLTSQDPVYTDPWSEPEKSEDNIWTMPGNEPEYVPVGAATGKGELQPGDHGTIHAVKAVITPKPDNKANLDFYDAFSDGSPRKFPTLYCANWAIDRLVTLTGGKPETFQVAQEIKMNHDVEYVVSDKKTSKGNYYKDVIKVTRR